MKQTGASATMADLRKDIEAAVGKQRRKRKAKDEDELSFQAGDVFIHVKRIDDGWMFAELEGSGDDGETTLACRAMSAWHGAGMQHVAGACGSPPLRSPG